MILNMYKHVKESWPQEYRYRTSMHQQTAFYLGIGKSTVYRILKEKGFLHTYEHNFFAP
jgi:hypothetical protein